MGNKIGLIGSSISENILRYDTDDYKIAFSLTGTPLISHVSENLDDKEKNIHSHNILKDYNNVDYLLIDVLNDVIAGSLYFNGKTVESDYFDYSSVSFLEEIGKKFSTNDNSDEYYSFWIEKFDKFYKNIQKHSKTQLILNKIMLTNKTFSKGILIDDYFKKEEIDILNQFIQKFENHIEENYEVKTLNYDTRLFVELDESILKFNKNYYYEMNSQLRDIVSFQDGLTFSIIVDARDNQHLLKESLSSITNQSFDVKHNCEIIIITDNANDNTVRLTDYYKNHSVNIQLINNHNSHDGVILSKLGGCYISIIKSGDYFNQNTLNNVSGHFEEKNVDMVSIMRKYYKNLEYETIESQIINLKNTPENIQLTDMFNFIRKEALMDVFDESDDFTTIMLKLLVNNPVYAIDNLSKYYSRQKDEVITETDLLKIDKVMDYSLREKGFILKFIQNIFFRNLQKYLEKNPSVTEGIENLLGQIDEKTVLKSQILNISSITGKGDKYNLKFNFTTPYDVKEYSFFLSDSKNDEKLNIEEHNDYQYSFDLEIEDISEEYCININHENLRCPVIIHLNSYLLGQYLKLADNRHFLIKQPKNNSQEKILKPAPNTNKQENIISSTSTVFHDETTFTFNFSVIMAVYNSAKYIRNTINSIINQTLDFEQNIQLILVNDGSTDNSHEICLEYQKKYPHNILVLSQQNGGQASARNRGLKYADGRYLNFLDSDDYVSENFFEEGLKFFTEYDNEIDVIAFPMFFFEKIDGPHTLNQKFNTTKIVDLNKEANYPQLSVSSTFIKYEAMKNRYFDISLPHAEDALLINRILLEKKKYGIINTAKYYYRQRIEENSTTDTMGEKKESFIGISKDFFIHMIDYCKDKEGQVPLFIQYMLAYDFQWFINQSELDTFHNESEKNEFWDDLYYILNHLEDKTFLENPYVSDSTKSYFKYIKNNRNRTFNVVNNNVVVSTGDYKYDTLNNNPIYTDIAEIKDNKLILTGTLNSFVPNDYIKIYLVKFTKNNILEKYECKQTHYNTFLKKNIRRLGVDWQFRYNFDIEVPLSDNEESKFKFIIEYDDFLNKASFDANIKITGNFGLSSVSSYTVNDNHILSFRDNVFHITPYSYKGMIKNELSTLKNILNKKETGYKDALKIRVLYSLIYPFYKNKQIWLFSDHLNFADDNASHLFKYAVKQKDNIRKYFVIDKNSPDFRKMKKINKNVVGFGTLKHKLLFLLSENSIYSYQNINFRNPFHDTKFKLYTDLITNKRNFIQHGVTIGDISEFHNKARTNISLLVTVSEEEKKSFSLDGYNFDENVVQILGFPRYDNLKDNKTRKQILFLPSWRNTIIDEETLLNSEYYERIQNFLNNNRLHEILEKNGYQIVFRPHPEFIKYRDLFDLDKRVRISTEVTEESYQDLFMESALMITDYSSVAFDFAYLKKPVLYYQFNKDYNYKKGYYDFESMGFGKVLDNQDKLINKIEEYINQDCIMEEKYIKRVDTFFKFNDKNNSKRVYEWLYNKKN